MIEISYTAVTETTFFVATKVTTCLMVAVAMILWTEAAVQILCLVGTGMISTM